MKYSIILAVAMVTGTAVPASAYTSAFPTTAIYMRTGPDVAYPPVGIVPAGAPLTVFGCIGGWQWCDVAWGPNRGWVAGMYLQAYWQGHPTPFYTAAPYYSVPILTFQFGPYWDTHYRGRYWYRQRDHWGRYDYGHRRWR